MKPDYLKISKFFDVRSQVWDNMILEKSPMFDTLMFLSQINEGDRILDVGCGTGVLEKHILKYCPSKIVALDLSKGMIEKARKKYSDEKIEFLNCNVLSYESDELFDKIFIYNVYPHILEREKFMEKILSLSKKNARFILAHGMGRKFVNSIHHDLDFELSTHLNEAKIEVKAFEEFFDIDILIDTDNFFMISGIKK